MTDSPTPTPETTPRPVRQARWRSEIQLVALLLVGLVVLVAIAGLYLNEASRAGVAGRDVLALEVRQSDLLRQNDILRSEIAGLRSVERLELRARDMGFRPATVDDLLFVEFQENPYTATPTPTPVPIAVSAIPEYNETLADWLLRNFFGSIGGAE